MVYLSDNFFNPNGTITRYTEIKPAPSAVNWDVKPIKKNNYPDLRSLVNEIIGRVKRNLLQDAPDAPSAQERFDETINTFFSNQAEAFQNQYNMYLLEFDFYVDPENKDKGYLSFRVNEDGEVFVKNESDLVLTFIRDHQQVDLFGPNHSEIVSSSEIFGDQVIHESKEEKINIGETLYIKESPENTNSNQINLNNTAISGNNTPEFDSLLFGGTLMNSNSIPGDDSLFNFTSNVASRPSDGLEALLTIKPEINQINYLKQNQEFAGILDALKPNSAIEVSGLDASLYKDENGQIYY